jgi:hypothetical protein
LTCGPRSFVFRVNAAHPGALVAPRQRKDGNALPDSAAPGDDAQAARLRAGRAIAESPRGARACDPGRRRLSDDIRRLPPKPGCTARSPGFLFLPRWRNRHTHASQKRAGPGSNPGWGTRFAGSFFYNSGCGKTRAGMAQGMSAASPASRRGFESRCLPHLADARRTRTSFGTTTPQVRLLPARPLPP